MIKLEMFKGIAPRYAPQSLPANAAQVAQNCTLDANALRPMKGIGSAVSGVSADVNAQSIYLYNRSTNAWLNYTADTDIVKSPISNDAYGRIYLSNGVAAKMKAIGSETLYDLGVQIPIAAGIQVSVDTTGRYGNPTDYSQTATYEIGDVVSANGAYFKAIAQTTGNDPPDETYWSALPTDVNPLDGEDRAYVITYVTAYDEEGPPSDPIYVGFVVYPGDKITLSSLPTGPSSGTINYDRKRIYRTNTGSASTEYQLVDTISLSTASYQDTKTSGQLGVVLPSVMWDAPPSGIKGLVTHPAGFLVGFSGRTIYCSELYLPHAWPYSYPVADDIVSLAVYGNTVLVMTTSYPYLMSGSAPDAMGIDKSEIAAACVSKRGVVDMGDVILYPSTDGLVAAGLSATPEVMTTSLISKDEWAKYSPSGFVASQWDGKYVAFCTHSVRGQMALIIDPVSKDITEVSMTKGMDAVYYDAQSGRLYLKLDTETSVKPFAEGSSMTYLWRSKVFRTPRPMNFGALQVFADAYPVTVKTYINQSGTAKSTLNVTSSAPVRLPAGFSSDIWEFELSGSGSVNAVHVAQTVQRLQGMS